MSGTEKPNYNGKHFRSALAHDRHQKRELVREEADKAFAAFQARGEIPLWVTAYDRHLAEKDKPRGQMQLHNPRWKVSQQANA